MTNGTSHLGRRLLTAATLLVALNPSGFAADPPARDLTLYPCHSYTERCGKVPMLPPQEVKWSGAVGDAERGRAIAFELLKGNCLACHAMEGGTQPGTIGPSLVGYAKRNLPLSYTYQRIYDIRVFNPNAHMPPFGTNKVLTDQEIRDIMAFLHKN